MLRASGSRFGDRCQRAFWLLRRSRRRRLDRDLRRRAIPPERHYRQHHHTKSNKRQPTIVEAKGEGVNGIERCQYLWRNSDVGQAGQAQGSEPYERHRSEQGTDASCATLLQHKKRDQHNQRYRQHVGFEKGSCDLQSLHGAQYRDSRGNDAVAEE